MSRIHELSIGAALAALMAAAAGCSGEPAPPPNPAPATPPPATKASAAPAAGDPVWHYEGAEGPDKWGTLSPKFEACGKGRAQSPVNIVNAQPKSAEPGLLLSFQPASLRIAHHEHVADGVNNGHTIQVNYAGGDTLTIGSDPYPLAQYHFHSPSEHTVSGKHFPMEMHLVHKDAGGRLAVIGVFIEAGAHNAAFDPIWNNLPAKKGVETHYPNVNVDVDRLLPASRTSYRYEGSLTTPPCSEGVRWIVMTSPIQLSAAQIGAFTALIRNNNRPTQPLNGRAIVTDQVGDARSR